jgi:hypothetical protein
MSRIALYHFVVFRVAPNKLDRVLALILKLQMSTSRRNQQELSVSHRGAPTQIVLLVWTILAQKTPLPEYSLAITAIPPPSPSPSRGNRTQSQNTD